ncbi:MAG TPA: phosphotransferase [Gaiellaceae bacterium]|nr:phosphotransferase [Gaiellaceae bacterium]
MTALPPDCPHDLEDELASRDAAVVRVEPDPPKTYLWLAAPGEALFAWYSTAPAHAALVAYEAAARTAIGTEGPLRAPPLLAVGGLWRVERALRAEPLRGQAVVDRVVEAAQALGGMELPDLPAALGVESRPAAFRRRLRTLRSPLPTADAVRARRVLEATSLPRVTSHGEFNSKHVLIEGGDPWIVDWELAAKRPLGYDLMTLWADLERDEDRDLLFEASIRALGDEWRAELRRLGYALLVRVITSALAEPLAQNRDPERARALLARLPAARRDALGG